MLNRFTATCNVAHWLCHWNLLIRLSPLHQQRDVEIYLPCGPSPAPICILEHLTSMPLTHSETCADADADADGKSADADANTDLLFCYKIVFGLVNVNFRDFFETVSYTHLTLPTNREV